jgi:hypothetical protein
VTDERESSARSFFYSIEGDRVFDINNGSQHNFLKILFRSFSMSSVDDIEGYRGTATTHNLLLIILIPARGTTQIHRSLSSNPF